MAPVGNALVSNLSVGVDMMKLTVLQMLEAKRGLDALAQKDLPVTTAWKIARMLGPLVPEAQAFDTAQKKLFEKYGEEEKGQRKIKLEHMTIFQAEMEKLIGQEVELKDGQKLTLAELGDVKVQAADLARVEMFIEETKV